MFKWSKLELADKVKLVISTFVRITIIVAIVAAVINQRWAVLFVSSLAMLLTFLPAIIERNYRVNIASEFELVIVLFIYAALFLGEVHGYYTRFWWWDIILHIGSGIALGFVGFLIMYILYYEKRVTTSPFWIAVFAFSFAVAAGAMWEIFEFAMDSFFRLNMQKSGLIDTMWDLIVDAGGALFTSVLGYFYIRGGRAPLFERLVLRFVCENPRLVGDVPEKCEPVRRGKR